MLNQKRIKTAYIQVLCQNYYFCILLLKVTEKLQVN